jgi:hypothetical protein
MKHPNQATWALYAGGDLGRWARWQAERHLEECDQCRGEVAAFTAVREIVPELSEIPEVSWNRLAAEMKANIRLGLAAGECVRGNRESHSPRSLFSGPRAAVALASMVALLVTGLMLEHPIPHSRSDGALSRTGHSEGSVVESVANGIRIEQGGQALQLMHPGIDHVTYSVGAQGSMRARYVNQDGYVTINNVYVEGQ